MSSSEIDAVRELLRSKPRPTSFPERRQRLDAIGSTAPLAGDIGLEPIDANDVAAEWSLAPRSDPSKALLFFHGGGYCSGSIVSHRGMVTEAGRAARARTLAVGYRLAPGHPFPAAIEDARRAYRFLLDQGIAPDKIAIAGDSAGGGLTLALMTSVRDAREPLPACAWLVSPWVNLQMTGKSLAEKAAIDPLISKSYLEELASAYLAGAVMAMHGDAVLDDLVRVERLSELAVKRLGLDRKREPQPTLADYLAARQAAG